MKRNMGFLSAGSAAFIVAMMLLAPGAMAAKSRGAGGGGGTTEGITSTNTTGADSPARYSSATLQGESGGTLVLDGWKLRVPAGAFTGTATITMIEVAGDVPTVDLAISDPSKNAFMVPVELSFKYKDKTEAADKVISWFNPATGSWIEVPGLARDTKGWVTVPLWHFSKYRTSRAGW